MKHEHGFSQSIGSHLRASCPDEPVLYFAPDVLQATAERFQQGFPGLVTYAVKANDSDVVLRRLVAAGIDTFDVASPFEMEAVRRVCENAVLHYNNPVRSTQEISKAVAMDVRSYSVDAVEELQKLVAGGVPKGTEVAVRLHLPIEGGAYNFGAKFGANLALAEALLGAVKEADYLPAMTFHPGTQCTSPLPWRLYIQAVADVANRAGVELTRLNVGGGFPAHRVDDAPEIALIFTAIKAAVDEVFKEYAPKLVCEPGRAMVADALTLATRVKAVRADGTVFLNDGIYGALSEAPSIGNVDRIEVVSGGDEKRQGALTPRTVFGPTCDSLDRLPDMTPLPNDLAEGDWVLFHGLGAYSQATVTRFNGYGQIKTVEVAVLD